MKTLTTTSLFVFLTIIVNLGYGQITRSAKIEIDKSVHDYGNLTQGDNGESYFKITNTGNQPLIVSKCKPSCGCTIPICPKKPILPGEFETIQINYDTQRVGPINKSVTIYSNDIDQPQQIIRIKGFINAKENTSPTNKISGPLENN